MTKQLVTESYKKSLQLSDVGYTAQWNMVELHCGNDFLERRQEQYPDKLEDGWIWIHTILEDNQCWNAEDFRVKQRFTFQQNNGPNQPVQ